MGRSKQNTIRNQMDVYVRSIFSAQLCPLCHAEREDNMLLLRIDRLLLVAEMISWP